MKKSGCSVMFHLFIVFVPLLPVYAQRITSMDFRNQAITDILMALADMGRQSIVADESVTGTATFHFSDSEFEEALYRFTDACNLFCEKRDGVYYVSRMAVSGNGDRLQAAAEDVNIELLVKQISRSIGKTILYDPLPRAAITVYLEDSSVQNAIEILMKRYPDYSVSEENGAYYIRRAAEQNTSTAARLSSSSITKEGDLYTLQIPRGSFSSIISLLFRTAGKEYSLLQRVDTSLENLYFEGKSFDHALRLVLEQGSCDYVESASVYYIFEIQRKDVLKKLKDTMVIQLQHVPVQDAVNLLPADFSGSSFIKVHGDTNSVYLTGSSDEIAPIADFIRRIDVPGEEKHFRRYEIQHVKVQDFITLLPRDLAGTGPVIIPESNAFISRVSGEDGKRFDDYIRLVDRKENGLPVRLKYIRSEELMRYLPPSAVKEELVVSSDPTLVFYTGTEEKRKQFIEHLNLIDQPKPQIRYQILVIQYQKSGNLTWNKSLSLSKTSASPSRAITGTFSNLLNINFDIVSELGYSLALQLNLQIGEDKARVLADTTLNGISGEDIKFENTNTFRYRDVAIDPETGKPLYTGTTREINSGLVLGINGWVSGDGMITMSVNAAISKQDESDTSASDTTNPPPTSERSVNTQVRTKSGTPIIIGGLLQVEKTESVKKLPVLGYIPLLGRLFQDRTVSDVTTEMVIYIVPCVHHGEPALVHYDKRNEGYFSRYILGEET
ncbi:hypothetical protein LJC14_00540 [Treponema sp. OttesenSCG-928-L16]|nr:hypothetical protein [Treponema sp. OttesenSCG-928-L16]